MLKKLLIVTLIGLTSSFVYAEEKKVTGEMLIGKWDCKAYEYSVKLYNSQGELMDDSTISKPTVFFIYKKEGEKIAEYPPTENENEKDFYDALGIERTLDENQLSQVEYKKEFNGKQIVMKIERNYISNDEFQMSVDSQLKEKNKDILRAVASIKSTCTKVK